jgi:serine/threonine protein kinase
MSSAPAEESDRAYVEFTRRLLDDMSSGLDYPPAYYVRLFPACAERILEDLAEEQPASDETVIKPRRGLKAATDPGALPDKIGDYEITGELATGGMGRLLLAKHPDHAEPLVIKTAKAGLIASDTKVLERLRREASILGRLDHDRICPMTDFIIEGERVFVVMPFIEGSTLEAQLADSTARARRGNASTQAWRAIGAVRSGTATHAGLPPGLGSVVALMEEVARAIHVAHEKGVVHRDLKPGNIMVKPDGRPIVLDFGLAVDLSDSHSRRLTSFGDVIGTPSHMAPEQIRSEVHQIDRRTDVYALGVILYEVLTHRRAFKGNEVRQIYKRVLAGDVVPPRVFNPEIPRDLEAVCQKAMEVERRRRYATALDFAEDLRRVLARERTVARPVSTARRAIRGLRRHPRAAAGIAGGLILLAVLVILMLS